MKELLELVDGYVQLVCERTENGKNLWTTPKLVFIQFSVVDLGTSIKHL